MKATEDALVSEVEQMDARKLELQKELQKVEIELNKVKMKYKETVAAHQKQQQQAYFNNDVLHNATKELLADVDATKDEVAAVATW
eukprot:9336742-Pyramimonas_sp.AAC.1